MEEEIDDFFDKDFEDTSFKIHEREEGFIL